MENGERTSTATSPVNRVLLRAVAAMSGWMLFRTAAASGVSGCIGWPALPRRICSPFSPSTAMTSKGSPRRSSQQIFQKPAEQTRLQRIACLRLRVRSRLSHFSSRTVSPILAASKSSWSPDDGATLIDGRILDIFAT
jgi:hypothetical protein